MNNRLKVLRAERNWSQNDLADRLPRGHALAPFEEGLEVLGIEGLVLVPRQKIVIPTYAEKEKAKAEKRKAASIFGGPPKPATS